MRGIFFIIVKPVQCRVMTAIKDDFFFLFENKNKRIHSSISHLDNEEKIENIITNHTMGELS